MAKISFQVNRRWTWVSVGIAAADLISNLIKNAFIKSILLVSEKEATNLSSPPLSATDCSSSAAAVSH